MAAPSQTLQTPYEKTKIYKNNKTAATFSESLALVGDLILFGGEKGAVGRKELEVGGRRDVDPTAEALVESLALLLHPKVHLTEPLHQSVHRFLDLPCRRLVADGFIFIALFVAIVAAGGVR